MNKKVKKIFQSNEPYIFLIIILLGIVVQIRSGQFFTANNIVDLLSAMIVPGLFAIAEILGTDRRWDRCFFPGTGISFCLCHNKVPS